MRNDDLSGEFEGAGSAGEENKESGVRREPDTAGGRVRDAYGRDVTDWIEVEGKLKPHP